MAGLTNDEAEPTATDLEVGDGDAKDPFLGNSQCFTWARDLGIGQLQEEVSESLSPEVRIAALFPHDGQGELLPVDAQHPITIYVTPSSADLAAVRQVLAAHRPDPYYGMSDEERTQAHLRAKIAAGEDLTPDEMQMALRMLVTG
jgi:hypothetical protein